MDPLFGRVLGRKWQTYEVTTGHCTYSISSTQVVADHPQQEGETSETTVRWQRAALGDTGSLLVTHGLRTLE